MLYTTRSEALILYIPQLVQAVRYDEVRVELKSFIYSYIILDGFCSSFNLSIISKIKFIVTSINMEYSNEYL